MAKRTRYASRPTGRRPAANRLVRRDPPKAKPAVSEAVAETVVLEPNGSDFDDTGAPVTATSRGLSQAEIDRAAQLEAQMTSREKSLQAATRARAEGHAVHAPVDVNAPLAVRAAKEYAYVARDVRRIALTGGLMAAILAVIAILVDVLGVLKI
jgi:hypothetical protein